ncbi:MAG: S8/S53 family peptidase [Silvibacterium sp.]|nr:S8/S53 family peptidase [Silvibacterium sp.]
MRTLRFPSLIAYFSIFAVTLALHAQERRQSGSSTNSPRITATVNEDQLVRLKGQVHPLLRTAEDQGAVPDNLPMAHMLLLLRRSPEREAALERLIDELHTPSSPNYQRWLTADEIGQRFGVAQADVAAVTDWLESHGFRVNAIYPSGMSIDVSGTAGQIREAFHTEIHYYSVNGERHIANASDPSIPAALAPVVMGFSSLNDIWPRQRMNGKLRSVKKDPATGGWIPVGFEPDFNVTIDNVQEYFLSPLDFAKIYNVTPLWTAARPITGKGQTIAIIGGSDILQGDWNTFRAAFGLDKFSGTLTQTNPPTPAGEPLSDNNNCTDPGLLGLEHAGRVEGEAALDTEWSSAVAPDAAIILASCANTATQFGPLIAANNLINGTNPPPIISVSFAACEPFLGSPGANFVNSLWQQAAAEGTSVIVGSGDTGSAQCDLFTVGPAVFGLAVSASSSTPYNVSVGGTDYQDFFQRTQLLYWQATNSPDGETAKSYVPEMPWNNSCANSFLFHAEDFRTGPAFCNSDAGAKFLSANSVGGGGVSILYTKPVWQTGVFGIPDDGRRDLPDIAFPAANGAFGHAMLICMSDPNGGGGPCNYNNPNDVVLNAGGGTSFGGPMFAGVQALINQKAGGRQGVSNYVLYRLGAAQYGSNFRPNFLGLLFCDANLGFLVGDDCLFHDVSLGDNSVPCVAGSPNCYAPAGSAYGVISTSTTELRPAYKAAPGWDFVTGLGSPNVTNLVNSWPAARKQ